jgi:addiction module RelE/StbE family toxin
MRIRWTAAAAADLEQIKDYLKERYPSFAQPTVLRLYQGVRSLKRTPYRGRQGREEGTRELVFAPLPYIAVYRVKKEAIEILHFHHTAQDRL